MPSDPTPDLAELERLEKAATPGPWRSSGHEIEQLSDAGEGYPFDRYPDCIDVATRGWSEGRDVYGITRTEDAALIAAARNALPALIRAARERDELRARAEKAEARAKEMSAMVFRWVCSNRGKDEEDVARHFGISGSLAVELVGELLNDGLVGYDE